MGEEDRDLIPALLYVIMKLDFRVALPLKLDAIFLFRCIMYPSTLIKLTALNFKVRLYGYSH